MSVLRVAYQGEPGAYSEVAALKLGGEAVGRPNFPSAFAALVSEECDVAVLPIENSLGGSLHENYDLLRREAVRILAETYLTIEHRLWGLPGATLDGARKVFSHPQALAQCQPFLREHPHLEPVPAWDTAGAAAEVARAGDPTRLAVAGPRAGELFALVELARPVAREESNVTRFLYLGRVGAAPPAWAARAEGRKTSLVFGLPHTPGSLGRALGAFAGRGLNLTKIESRPTRRRPFEYDFYLDFDGDAASGPGLEALEVLRALALELKLLGCYGAL